VIALAKHQIIRIVFVLILVPLSLISVGISLRLPPRPYAAYFILLYLSIVFAYLTLSNYSRDRRIRSRLDYHEVQGEDARILQEARLLCDQLGVRKLDLKGLSWASLDPRSSIRMVSDMPSDQCVIKNDILYLPVALRGRLGEDQLRPIIASSIVFYYTPRIQMKENLALVGFLLAPMLALIVTIALAGPILAPGGPPTLLSLLAVPLFVVWPFVVIFYGGSLISMTIRRLWLEADRITARVISRETLLEALKKMRDGGFPDESRLGRRRNYLLANSQDSQRPSLSERIDNLVRMKA
jgi:hypothetical protein